MNILEEMMKQQNKENNMLSSQGDNLVDLMCDLIRDEFPKATKAFTRVGSMKDEKTGKFYAMKVSVEEISASQHVPNFQPNIVFDTGDKVDTNKAIQKHNNNSGCGDPDCINCSGKHDDSISALFNIMMLDAMLNNIES